MFELFLNYTDWQPTADTLHMILQISGKIKLASCDKRPQWSHVRHYLTVDGLTTGIVPGIRCPFQIYFNFMKHYIEISNTEDRQVRIPLKDGFSVAWYYKKIVDGMDYIGSAVNLNTRCQEFYDPVDLDKDDKHHSYNPKEVKLFLENLHFAQDAMRKFISPFRGKVDNPAYYFGTMDLSAIIYSGEPAPYGKHAAISAHAFDERNFEFGYWPGDPSFPKAAFYILPYPFVTDIQGNDGMILPDKAWFSPEKKEFFLTMEDALSYKDPIKTIGDFFQSGFDIVQKLRRWENLDWITHPLQY